MQLIVFLQLLANCNQYAALRMWLPDKIHHHLKRTQKIMWRYLPVTFSICFLHFFPMHLCFRMKSEKESRLGQESKKRSPLEKGGQ